LQFASLTGNQGPGADECPEALIFCGIAYPVVLFLIWMHWRINGRGDL